jgi:HPt (histidine-containing phosphotransfer) domain-containing protein
MLLLDDIIRRWVRGRDGELQADQRQEAKAQREVEHEVERSESRDCDLSTASILDFNITGLNIEQGLDRFGGNEETYLDVLRSFVDNTAALIDSLAQPTAVSRENLADYAVMVHGIKGSSRSIGAESLGALAEQLEGAAKDGKQQFVQTNNQTLIAQTRTLLNATSAVLTRLCGESQKPLKNYPDQATLKQLQRASADFSMDGIDAAMADLESYDYDQDGALVTWLREQVDCLGFTAISTRLAAEL